MKLFYTIAAATLLAAPAAHAQDYGYRNEIKLNLPSLALANFSIQYERSLIPGLSVALGARFGPERNLPGSTSISASAGNDSVTKQIVDGIRINNYAFTPEVRYYFGKGEMSGFYIGVFGRVGEFNIKAPYTFDDQSQPNGRRQVDLKGGYSYGAVGLQLGAKFNLSERLSLDWFFAGPMFMSGNVKLNAATDLSMSRPEDRADAEQSLRETFDNASVTTTGITVERKLSLPAVRTGLALGFRF